MISIGLIILFFLTVVLAAFNNAAQIRLRDKESIMDQNIWHFTSSALRGIITLVIVYSCFGCSGETVKLWILTQLFWWVFFDGLLNLLRGRSILYVGQTDIIDKTIRKIAKVFHLGSEITSILLKLICILITIII